MREAMRQAVLALALPATVMLVWAIRGEAEQKAPLPAAAVFRPELEALPLPTRERLRPPDEAGDWRPAVRRHPEPDGRRRRALLPAPPAAAPAQLALEPGSTRVPEAAPPPREAALPTVAPTPAPGAGPAAPLPLHLDPPLPVHAPLRIATSAPHSPDAVEPEAAEPIRYLPQRAQEMVSGLRPGAGSVVAPLGTTAGPSSIAAPRSGVAHRPAAEPRGDPRAPGPDLALGPKTPVQVPPVPVGLAWADPPAEPGGDPRAPGLDLALGAKTPAQVLPLPVGLAWAGPPAELPAQSHGHRPAFVDPSTDFSSDELAPIVFPQTVRPQLIPEPASALLLAVSLAGIAAARRYRLLR